MSSTGAQNYFFFLSPELTIMQTVACFGNFEPIFCEISYIKLNIGFQTARMIKLSGYMTVPFNMGLFS